MSEAPAQNPEDDSKAGDTVHGLDTSELVAEAGITEPAEAVAEAPTEAANDAGEPEDDGTPKLVEEDDAPVAEAEPAPKPAEVKREPKVLGLVEDDDEKPKAESTEPKINVREAFSNAKILASGKDYKGADSLLRSVIQDKHVKPDIKFKAWKARLSFATATKNPDGIEKAKKEMAKLAVEAFEASKPADVKILIDGAKVDDKNVKEYLSAQLEKAAEHDKKEHAGVIAAALGTIEDTPIRERIALLTIGINNLAEAQSEKSLLAAANSLRQLIKPLENAIGIKDDEKRGQAFDAL